MRFFNTSHVKIEIYMISWVVFDDQSNMNFVWFQLFLFNNLPYRGAVSPRTLATMDRQSSLLSVIWSSCAEVIPPPTVLARVSTSLILGLPLPLLPSTLPVTQTLSSWFCLMTCPRNLSCLRLIVLISSLSAPARCNTTSLVILSVHGILSILLNSHISIASIFLSVCLLIFQDSQP